MRRPSTTTWRAVYAPIYGWDHCLPHWTTPERSEARYVVTSAGLQLRIAADQVDWRPEGARLRVSNIQAGVFSGETDSCAVPTTIGWMG
jgi:hypothetical protein